MHVPALHGQHWFPFIALQFYTAHFIYGVVDERDEEDWLEKYTVISKDKASPMVVLPTVTIMKTAYEQPFKMSAELIALQSFPRLRHTA